MDVWRHAERAHRCGYPVDRPAGSRLKYVFNVFDRMVSVEQVDGAWRCFLLGTDGKRRPMELAIPHDVAHDELAQYLYDIYHEDATSTNGDVFEVDPPRG